MLKRCSKCILPENYPNITFDDKGECNYCGAHHKIQYLGAAKLRDLLAKYRQKGGKFDCLVPISGGKDSTYVLYQMSKVYQMRVLAFNHDNCFTHVNAKENIQRMVSSLGIDLVTITDKNQRKFMATNLKAYLRKPSVAMVPMLCTGCRYGIIGNAFRISKEYDIPIIIIGWSPIEDTPFKEAYLRNQGGQ
jgi:tRNA(Ile)-lysidine synthase TilS/MesJ